MSLTSLVETTFWTEPPGVRIPTDPGGSGVLRRRSTAVRLLGSRVRLPPGAYGYLSCVFYSKDKRNKSGQWRNTRGKCMKREQGQSSENKTISPASTKFRKQNKKSCKDKIQKTKQKVLQGQNSENKTKSPARTKFSFFQNVDTCSGAQPAQWALYHWKYGRSLNPTTVLHLSWSSRMSWALYLLLSPCTPS